MKTKSKTVAKKLGRPQGAVSFTEVRLAELIERYKPDQVLPVSRVFLEKQTVEQPAPLVTMTITNLSQENIETIRHALEDGEHPQKVAMALPK